MTDFRAMANDQLDEWLAVNVMGWHEDSDHMNLWLDKDGKITTDKEDWQPTRDLNQAVMCAEKWSKDNDCEMVIYYKSHWVVDFRCGSLYPIHGDSLTRALCEAVAMAVEGEG